MNFRSIIFGGLLFLAILTVLLKFTFIQKTLDRYDQRSKTQASEISTIKINQSVLQQNHRDVDAIIALKQVAYLIRLAFYTITYEHNIKQAASMLQEANNILTFTTPLSRESIRPLLSQVLAQIDQLSKFNPADIAVKLIALQEAVSHLKRETRNHNTEPASPIDSKKLSYWQQLLKNIVIIRKNDQPLLPLMTAETHEMVIQAISMVLERAMWGALHDNEALYLESLKQALRLIHDSFDIKNTAINSVVTALKDLQKIRFPAYQTDIELLIEQIDKALHAEQHDVSKGEQLS